jgi:hypothetical protein
MAGKLSPRDRKLIKKLAAGKPKRKSAIEVGFPPKGAHVSVSRKLKDATFVDALDKALEKAGLSDDNLAKKHAELLHAQKTVSAVSGKDAGAGTVDFVDVPDYQTQAKALDMAYKVKGKYVEKHEQVGPLTVEIVKFSSGDGDAGDA